MTNCPGYLDVLSKIILELLDRSGRPSFELENAVDDREAG